MASEEVGDDGGDDSELRGGGGPSGVDGEVAPRGFWLGWVDGKMRTSKGVSMVASGGGEVVEVKWLCGNGAAASANSGERLRVVQGVSGRGKGWNGCGVHGLL